jgi:23S rRNA (uridine2552-2'-O)-methyltransferase
MCNARNARDIAGARPSRSWNWTTSTAFSCLARGWWTSGARPEAGARWRCPGSTRWAKSPARPQGRIIGVDLQEVDPIPGSELHVLDFLEDGADEKIKAWLDGPADVVMSDMAAASSGHKQTDHLRIIALGEAAAELAFDVLAPGGTFVAKVLAGGAEGGLQTVLKQRFEKVANVKPPASPFPRPRPVR